MGKLGYHQLTLVTRDSGDDSGGLMGARVNYSYFVREMIEITYISNCSFKLISVA